VSDLYINIFEARSRVSMYNFCYSVTLCAGERVRNRDRVLQIRDLHKGNKSSLASLLAADDDDGFEEDENFGK
jgi:hypothetical protein